MLQKILAKAFGTENQRLLKRLQPRVVEINAREPEIQALSDDQLRAKTDEFRTRVERGEGLDDLLVESFAVVREAGWRTLQMRHFDVQLIGGMVLHRGTIAEMKTGEGKTLVATLAAYLNALGGDGVHVVTVNDYLARRDSEWMGRIYRSLGMTVGVIQHDMQDQERQAAYACDITYGTNNEFGFDYLRDNMKFEMARFVQRGHHFAIVDEVDSILIDEARTPLIISGPAEQSTELYYEVDRAIPHLKQGAVTQGNVPAEKREELESTGDFLKDEKHKTVSLTETGMAKAEKLLRPVFKDGGTVTAGNSAGINDGAAAVVVMSRERAEAEGLTPRLRWVGRGVSGVDPSVMGIGPVPSTRKVLEKTGMAISDLDLVELNEAFAAQALYVLRELEMDWERTNVNGSGISLGHPVGATGAIMTVKLMEELTRTDGQFGLVTMCVGGGQGVSTIFERLN